MKETNETATIERLGTFPGVYRVTPAMAGRNWHLDKDLQLNP